VDRLYVAAEGGAFGLGPAFNAVGTQGYSKEGPMQFTTKPYQQIDQLDDFASCILEGRPTPVSGEEALKDLRIIEAIWKSIETARDVKIV
jgi:predicted dehydrogenase